MQIADVPTPADNWGRSVRGRAPAIRAVFVGAFSSLDKGFLRLDANGLQIDLL